jgi:hypothetical protein
MTDDIKHSNISANTSTFVLSGGLYGVSAIATWGGGSATLQMLSADGSTYVTAMTAFSADGYATAYLPAGTYRWAVATATGVYVRVRSIPLK